MMWTAQRDCHQPMHRKLKRVYLGVYCYKTSTSAKDRFYKTETYNGIKYNIFNAGKGAPKEKTYIVQGRDGKLVPAYGNDTTTMVGWIPYDLLGKDIKLYVEEVPPRSATIFQARQATAL